MNSPGDSGAVSQRLALECQAEGIWESGGYVELRFRRVGQQTFSQEWFTRHQFDTFADRVAELAPDADVYVGALGRSTRSGKAANCLPSRWLWADCDDPQAVGAATELAPSIVVETSPGRALAMWRLSDPLPVDRIREANTRLAIRLGADTNCCDPARIVRVAGSYNHKGKYGPVPSVVCTRLESALRYSTSELVGHLSDPESRQSPPARSAAHTMRVGDDPLLLIPAAEYIGELIGSHVGRDGKVRCPFHGNGSERTPSLHAYDDPSRGWYCFGCDRGGDVYGFAAELYGLCCQTDFPAVRTRLIADLRGGGNAQS